MAYVNINSWLQVDPQQGVGDGSIANKALPNTGRSPRTATIKVANPTFPDTNDTYIVNQNASDETLVVNNGAVDQMGGSVTLVGTSNSSILSFESTTKYFSYRLNGTQADTIFYTDRSTRITIAIIGPAGPTAQVYARLISPDGTGLHWCIACYEWDTEPEVHEPSWYLSSDYDPDTGYNWGMLHITDSGVISPDDEYVIRPSTIPTSLEIHEIDDHSVIGTVNNGVPLETAPAQGGVGEDVGNTRAYEFRATFVIPRCTVTSSTQGTEVVAPSVEWKVNFTPYLVRNKRTATIQQNTSSRYITLGSASITLNSNGAQVVAVNVFSNTDWSVSESNS